MKPPFPLPIPQPEFFTAFVLADRINVLVRSADWYKVTPIVRYLYNMAASAIYLEDARTETRTYTFERYDHLRGLIDRSTAQEWEVAFEAMMTWSVEDHHFGVVHLDQADGRRGNLLLGDDPLDYAEFAPDDVVMVAPPPRPSAPDTVGRGHV